MISQQHSIGSSRRGVGTPCRRRVNRRQAELAVQLERPSLKGTILQANPIMSCLRPGKPDGACREAGRIQKSSPRRQQSGFNKFARKNSKIIRALWRQKKFYSLFLWRTFRMRAVLLENARFYKRCADCSWASKPGSESIRRVSVWSSSKNETRDLLRLTNWN